MLVSAGNLSALVGFTFSAAQLTGLSVASYARSASGTLIDILAQVLGAAAAPAVPQGVVSYTVASVDNGTNQITVGAFAGPAGSGASLGSVTFYAVGYNQQSILVSLQPLANLMTELQAGQSISGQIGAITGGVPGKGAVLRFTQGASFLGALACFARGTRILASRGEVAIERLAEGSLVPGQVSGRLRRVVWIGQRTVDVARHPRPWDAAPVRVHAHAFAPGQPRRDVRLSPDHAVLVGGGLIPVRYLLNGATVTQELVATITYLHVELDAHDVLLADGLPCESFLDTGNRSALARPWRLPAPMIPTDWPQLQHGEPG